MARASSRSLVISLFASFYLLITSTLASGSTCYWQNSTLAPTDPYSVAPNDVPCFPAQENSPCCAAGWTCQSDGICKISQTDSDGETNDFYYRGTCTDSSWSSPQCPYFCFAQNANQSWPLSKCSSSTTDDSYCCSGDTSCNCQTGADVLNLGNGSEPYTVTVIGSTTWPGYTSTSTPFSVSEFTNAESATSSAARVTSTTRVSTDGAGGAAATTAQSGEPSSGATSSGAATGSAHTATRAAASSSSTNAASNASSTTTTSSSKSSSSSTTALAAGLGAGLGVAFLAALLALAYILVRRRRRSTKTSPMPLMTEMPGSSHPGWVKHSPTASASGYDSSELGGDSVARNSELPGAGEYMRSEVAGDTPKGLYKGQMLRHPPSELS